MTDIVVNASRDVAQIEKDAVAAIESVERVDTPEEAEALLRKITAYQQAVRLAKVGREQERRWGGIRLQAERKMGELLGPAERGNPTLGSNVEPSHIEQGERDIRKHARKVAAVPEETFTEYIEEADEPTRAGLLRAAKPAAAKPEPEYTTCPTCGHRVRADKPLRPRGGQST